MEVCQGRPRPRNAREEGRAVTSPIEEKTRVSMVASARSTKCQETTLGAVLEGIRAGRWREPVGRVRALVNAGEDPANEKKKLPAVLFSGTFTRRAAAAIEKHSGFLVLDFDHLDALPDHLDALRDDAHIYAAWLSPSGTGIKALVRIPPEADTHGAAFDTARAYLKNEYGLDADPSGRDVSRLCFVSFDPGLTVNAGAKPLIPVQPVEDPPAQNGKDLSQSAPMGTLTPEQVEDLLSHIPPRPEYATWLKIVAAVVGAVGPSEAVPLLQRWSPEEEEGEYRCKIASGLNRVGPGTLVMLAKENGWTGRLRRGMAPMGSTEDGLDLGFVEACAASGQRGDAELFAALHEDNRRFDHSAKLWRRFCRGQWELDEKGQTRREASHELAQVYLDAAAGIDLPAERASKRGDRTPEEHRHARLLSKADQLCARGYLDGVLDLAGGYLAALTNEFDRAPLLLNVRNGTLDLETGAFRPHDPRDLLSVQAPVVYDPKATAPRWSEFVDTVMGGDAELSAFLRRFLGVCLSGLTDLDAFGFLYGGGANGKSTLLLAVEDVLGAFTAHLNMEALLASQRDSTTEYQVLGLRGARLAIGTEIPEGKRLNEALVKDLSGGDVLTARAPYQMPVSFEPSHKLILCGNHKPVIGGQDFGIWRRVLLIPFDHRFPEPGQPGHRARSEVLAEFQKERSGILNWLLDGWRDYRENGLRPPAQVLAATANYRNAEDVLGAFLGDRCEVGPDYAAPLKELYAAWRAWASEGGEDLRRSSLRTKRGFCAAMEARGFERKTGKARALKFYGLRLADDEQGEMNYAKEAAR